MNTGASEGHLRVPAQIFPGRFGAEPRVAGPGSPFKEMRMATRSQRSTKRASTGGPRKAPATKTRKAPARGKPGKPRGAESTTARRTAKSAKTTKSVKTSKPRASGAKRKTGK
jgi:hypothetical protein